MSDTRSERTSAAAGGHENEGGPRFTSTPAITQNPNPRVPLAAILRFATDRPVQTTVTVADGRRTWDIRFKPGQDPAKGLPLLGLRPGRRHEFRVTIRDSAGGQTEAREPLVYLTPALPASQLLFPPVIVKSRTAGRMEPGVTILSVRRGSLGRLLSHTPQQKRFEEQWGMLLAIDEEGEPVWYYESDVRVAGVDRLRNGNIFFHTHDFKAVEIDLLGNVVTQWYAGQRPQGPVAGAIPIRDIQTLHHQPHEMPSGNFLGFSANARRVEDYYTSETDPNAPRAPALVMGDRAIEYTRQGEIVWSWDTFDHLDQYRLGYDTLQAYWHIRGFPHHRDWTHGNGLSYDERDDAVLLYFRIQDAMVKVDRGSGEIRWILGEPSDWSEALERKLLRPVGDLRWPYHGHNPRRTHAGTLLFFDNGIHQARPFRPPLPPDQTFSRAVEYEVDEAKMTVSQVWSSGDELTEDSFNSWAMGDAHRLPRTDNVLTVYAVCVPRRPGLSYGSGDDQPSVTEFPVGARIREYARTTPAEILWDVSIADPDDVIQWMVYGGLRAPSLYPPDIAD